MISSSLVIILKLFPCRILFTQEPLNILSSATVDPSLIPLPPLPPIALPTDIADLPFAELGLNSWWPPGWVQWGLEYSHNVLGGSESIIDGGADSLQPAKISCFIKGGSLCWIFHATRQLGKISPSDHQGFNNWGNTQKTVCFGLLC